MSAQRSTCLVAEYACLTAGGALRFAAGSCSDSERAALDGHVDVCSDCQQLVAAALAAVDAERTPMDAPRVGLELCARYQLVRAIGRGGMGEVFEAFDRILKERVALKLLARDLHENDRAVRYFKAEAQLARRIAHPNVCRVFDVGVHDTARGPLYFISMELIAGETLRSRLQRARPELREVARWARELAAGLSAAHAAGVLHRDFKSDNVLLRAGTSAVITDFGLAQSLRDERVTPSVHWVGSAAYMAPEQVCGEALTPATDIYAFGVVLFEMLTGELPFRGSTPFATALSRLTRPAPAPSRHRSSLPKTWDDLVLSCLERDPAKRLGTAERVLEALDRIDRPRARGNFRLRAAMTVLLAAALSGERPTTGGVSNVREPAPPPATSSATIATREACEPSAPEPVPAAVAPQEPAPQPSAARARAPRTRPNAPKRETVPSVDSLIDPFE